jgi:hypothetical protein
MKDSYKEATMKHHARAFTLVALSILLLGVSPSATFAQTTSGTVNGVVRDETGAVVPNADATLKNEATGVEMVAKTNASGYYTFVNVQPGTYTVSVKVSGFKTALQPKFAVGVNQTVTHDFALSVGEITQTIEVTAEAALIQQSTSELGTVIAEQAVKDLPLNGRNFTQLLTLTPGATPINTAQGNGGGTGFNAPLALPGSTFIIPSVNGQWNRTNLFLLDGIVNEFFFGSSYAILPIIDAVQEFKVQSHNDKAEYGGVLGGVINVVSKSGGNQLHGSGWEFLRNDVFDARDPFKDAARDSPTPFRQNMFGATVGGPVYIPKLYNGKDKTWFFFGYEGWRFSQSQQQLYNVPTDQELAGDFSNSLVNQTIYDPRTTRVDPNNPQAFIRTPFANNIIPSDRFSPFGASGLPAINTALVPDGLDLAAAATVPLNGLAAAQLVDLLGDGGGRNLLVTGAAGAVGGYVIPLAQDRGWRVTGLARAEDEKFVRGLGAEFTAAATPGWDAVADGAVLQEQGVALVRDGGLFVGVQPGRAPAAERGVTVHVVVAHPDGLRLAQLLDAAAAGHLPARVHAVVPLDQVAAVHRAVAKGGVRGKYVLQP